MNPYFFVVGVARSGTTLLQRMLDAHRLLAVVNETYWVPRKFRERNGLTRGGLVTPALLSQLLESPRFPRMGLDRDDLERLAQEDPPVSYARFVSRVFDLYAERRGKSLAGDKTPGYVRKINAIHTLCPHARFVHIVRDPRDVFLSMRDWAGGARTAGKFGTWLEDPAVTTALYWRYSVALGREAGQDLGQDRYHEVRYEDLVRDPVDTLTELCRFLDLPFDEAMTRFYEGRTNPKPGRDTKAQWLPPTTGLRDWTTQLEPSATERIEAAVGDLLAQFGYERRFPEPSRAASAHVADVYEIFTSTAVAMERKLPQGW